MRISPRILEKKIAIRIKNIPVGQMKASDVIITPVQVERDDELVIKVIAIASDKNTIEKELKRYAEAVLSECSLISEKELYASETIDALETAIDNNFLENDSPLLSELGLHDPVIIDTSCLDMNEAFLRPLSAEAAVEKAEALTAMPELEVEVRRIFASYQEHFIGNPAQYIIFAESRKLAKEAEYILFSALHEANRLGCNRLTTIPSDSFGRRGFRSLNDFLSYQRGSIVVYTIEPDDSGVHTFPPRESTEEFDKLLGVVRDNSFDVLSVFEIVSGSPQILSSFENCLSDIPYIVIAENKVSREGAEVMLRSRAVNDFPSIVEDKLPLLTTGKLSYTNREIEDYYRTWHSEYLCREVFPDYAFALKRGSIGNVSSEKSASSRLDELIGLAEAKKTIREMVDYASYQVQAARRGVKVKDISRHMVFTGNPGTAKTTVARLSAEILKENKVLKYGDIVEVGRADIVDQYLGGTAPRVRKLFKRAEGNILFIDEAYSLLDDREGLYGDEAINTIVQEMENHRDDVIVIFAGYPDKMETFLQRNPGLRSRISFHVKFEDYSPDELFSILKLIAKEDGFTLADDVEVPVMNIFNQITNQLDFGNGRFVRNLYEKAKLNSIRRFLKEPDQEQLLHGEDFEMPVLCTHEMRSIGFQF